MNRGNRPNTATQKKWTKVAPARMITIAPIPALRTPGSYDADLILLGLEGAQIAATVAFLHRGRPSLALRARRRRGAGAR